MNGKLIRKVGITAAFIAALTAALMFAVAEQAQVCDGFGCAGTSATAGYAASSAKSPTLTNDIGRPSDGAEWQRPIGVGLLAVGLLGLCTAIRQSARLVAAGIARAGRAPTRGIPEGTRP